MNELDQKEGMDSKLGQLLRAGAPPARDPFFRIAVIERLSRQRYQQGRRKIHITAVGVALLTGAAYLLTPAALLQTLLVGAFCAGLATAALFSARGVQQVWSVLRPSRS